MSPYAPGIVHNTMTAALDKLEALGSREAIAEYLTARNYRGYRESSSKCPVALFLTMETGRRHLVGPGCATADRETFDDDRPREFTQLGPNVTAFIAAFDGGQFPELDRPRFRVYDIPVS